MSADLARDLTREKAAERTLSTRARILLALGPLTALSGLVWAIVQPYRLTLLHPHGQGFWWLIAEPPLYVMLVGVLFRFVLVPGIVADLQAAEEEVEAATGTGLPRSSRAARAPKDRNLSPWR